MAVRIQAIPNNSKDFLAVLALARTNSKTLGFLPTAAFSNYAISGQLVGAFEKERLLGYLLYAVNRTYSFIYIVHLCVTVEFRGRGIARQLFNSLKKQTSIDFRGVRVRCRRDYEARKLWPKIGFVAIGETPGRSKQGSTLTVWWYDYGHQDLFSFESIRSLETRLHAVIDANIFFKLLYPNTERDTGAKALLNDWMQESVELCVTKEILNEIHENAEKTRSQKICLYIYGGFLFP
jgi:GNAT superfamily N-acetyltransferase